MILQALKEYYDRKAADPDSGIAPLGWERKEIPFLIVLNDDGLPVAIEDTREMEGKKKRAKSFLVPQAEKRAINITANLFWDNVEYAIGAVCKGKPDRVRQQHAAFLARLDPYSSLPVVTTVLKFLKKPDRDDLLSKYDTWMEAKETCAFVSFKVAGEELPVFRTPEIVAKIDRPTTELVAEDTSICLITGEADVAERLHPAIKGVQGANTTGGNIVSFNFPASTSFGKAQGMNAPIGRTAVFAYATALNTLLGKDSKQKLQVGDATTVFWSSQKSVLENVFVDFWAEPPKDDPDRLTNAVAALFKSVETGVLDNDSSNTAFYVLGLSPNAARISIRFWHCGPVTEITGRIRQHFDDLRIAHGPKERDHFALWRLLVSTAALGKSENVAPNLAGDTMRAILDGRPYPATLLAAVVRRIKAEHEITHVRAALLKAVINRKSRYTNANQKEEITVSLDTNNTNIGYRLGRLFAALEKIQADAQGSTNATIRDRFYGSASGTPSTVFGTLMRMKNHHLAKLPDGLRIVRERLLGEIMGGVMDFSPHLNLEDQGRFAIGYYHQMQDFFTKKDKQN